MAPVSRGHHKPESDSRVAIVMTPGICRKEAYRREGFLPCWLLSVGEVRKFLGEYFRLNICTYTYLKNVLVAEGHISAVLTDRAAWSCDLYASASRPCGILPPFVWTLRPSRPTSLADNTCNSVRHEEVGYVLSPLLLWNTCSMYFEGSNTRQ